MLSKDAFKSHNARKWIPMHCELALLGVIDENKGISLTICLCVSQMIHLPTIYFNLKALEFQKIYK